MHLLTRNRELSLRYIQGALKHVSVAQTTPLTTLKGRGSTLGTGQITFASSSSASAYVDAGVG